MHTEPIRFQHDDRRPPGAPRTCCTPNAIAIAADLPFQQVFDKLRAVARELGLPDTLGIGKGTSNKAAHAYLLAHGWRLHGMMPLTRMPLGRLIVTAEIHLISDRGEHRIVRHDFAMIDRVVRDAMPAWPALLEVADEVDVVGYYSRRAA